MAVSAMAVPGEKRTAGRLLPLGGIVFVVLVVTSFAGIGGDTPGIEDSAAKINSFYDAHHARALLASMLIAASAPFLVAFGTSLASTLWSNDAVRRPFWQVALVAASGVAGAGWLVTAAIHFALADAAGQKGMGPGALQALNAFDADSWILFNGGMGVLLLAAGGALLSRGVHPLLGWIALVAGIMLFIPYASFVGLLVSGLWTIAMSVQLYRKGTAFADA